MIRVTLRLPDPLHKRLLSAAQHRRTSLNQVILASLNEALPEASGPAPSERAEELRRIKKALGAMEIDVEHWIDRLGLPRDAPTREELFRSLPRLDPPLSQTIIEDREESP